MNTYMYVYVGSALLALLAVPPVIRLAYRIGAVDRPGPRAVHKRPIPRIGGLAIFSSVMGLIGAVVFLDRATGDAFWKMREELAVLLGSATFVFLIGLVDDLKGLPARFKLLAELVAAAALCVVGVRIDSLQIADGFVLHLGGWGCLLTLLWVVGVTNAVNLSDGLDGLAAGICLVACVAVTTLALHWGDPVLAVLMLAMAGSLSGFLWFNYHPASVFMGDCGSLFLGFTLAASSAMCVAKSHAVVGLTLPALALGIPLCDMLFAVLRRFLEGRSLFAPDRSHFHHRLLDLGLHQRQAAFLVHLVTLLATGLGLFMLPHQALGSLAVFGCLLLVIVFLFRAVGAIRLRETLIRLREKLAESKQEMQEKRTFEQLQLHVRQVKNTDEQWRSVCRAAEQLGLAWVSLRAASADGGMETAVWRRPDTPHGPAHIVTMSFPLSGWSGNGPVEFEIAILINGSLESANHRASLFTRLVDECVVRDSPGLRRTNARDTAIEGRLHDAHPPCGRPRSRRRSPGAYSRTIHAIIGKGSHADPAADSRPSHL